MIEITEDEARTLRLFANMGALANGDKLPRDLAIKLEMWIEDVAYPRNPEEHRTFIELLKTKYNRKH